ncbi:MAG: AAA family ATPase [bacterium]
MRILSIELGGFLSYSSPQSIDFTRANVFCISGPNGAGKSSILDGIVYALYGKIPRYAGRRINTEEDIINHNSDRLYLSLKFKVGDRTFLVKRELLRGRSQQANIYELINDKPMPLGVKRNKEVNALIENLLGMDYETFTRTVILPQNQIDRFLKPSSSEAFSERRQILQRLLGLDIYKEMKKLASQRCKDISKELQLIANRLEGELKIYNKEFIREIERKLKENERLLDSLEEERWAINKEIENLKEIINIFANLLLNQKNYQDISLRLKELSRYKEDADRLETVYQLQLEAIPLRNMIKEFSEKKTRLEALTKEKLEIEEKIEKYSIEVENEEKKTVDYQRYLEYAERLLGFTSLAGDIKTLELERQRINKARKDIEIREQNLFSMGKEIENIRSELEAYESKLNELRSELEERSKVWEELKGVVENVRILKSKELELIEYSERQEKLEKTKAELEEVTSIVEKDLDTLSRELESLEKAIDDSHIQRLIDSLSVGDTCPVCGNVITRFPERTREKENLEGLLALYQGKKKSWQESFERFSTLKVKLKQSLEEIDIIRNSTEILKKDIEEAKSNICRVLEKYFGVNYILDELYITARLEEDRKKLEDSFYSIEKKREVKAVQLKDKENLYKKEYEAICASKEELTKEEEELKEKERILLERVFESGMRWEDFLTRNFLKESQEIKSKYQILLDSSNKAISSYKASINSSRTRIEQINAEAKEIMDHLISLKEEIENMRQDISSRCQQVGITLEELIKIKVDKLHIERIKREYNELTIKQGILRDEISKLREALIKIGEDPDKPEKLSLVQDLYNSKLASLKELEEKIGIVSKEIGSLETQLKTAKENLSIAESLSDKKKELERKLNCYKVVDEALSENRFPEFLMREVMENIIDRASIQFSSLTQGRYSFSLASDDSADIVVNDNWYPAQKRKTYSLSGGESFLASIALAIAIAEEIRGKKSVDCLFIDEGFGSLDDTGLDNIVSALAELENSGIMIGVITHNKELASRFPYRIEVEKDARGSRVKGEW